MARAHRTIRHAACVVLVLGACACAGVFGFESLQDVNADAGPIADVRSDSESDSGDPCGLPALPSSPGLGAGSADSVGNLTFAMSALSIAPGIGLNLDGLCTTTLENSSCLLDNKADIRVVGDDDGGLDVTGNKVLQSVASFVTAFLPSGIEGSIAYGYANFLVSLQGWNGEPDDGFVAVNTYASRGLEGALESGTIDRRTPNPGDVQERWTWRKKATTTGYVAGGRIVAHFETPLTLLLATQIAGLLRPPPGGQRLDRDAGTDAGTVGADDERPLILTLRDAYLLADVVSLDGGSYELKNGIVAGRIMVEPFIDEAVRIRNLSSGDKTRPFCVDGQLTSNLIFNGLCSARDVRADRKDDRSGVCDSVSIGVSFAGKIAALGAEDKALLPDPCPRFPAAKCGGNPPQIPDAESPVDASSDAQ